MRGLSPFVTRILAACLLLCLSPQAARAEVTVTFWSHDRDRNYEHTFIVMRGTVDATGERVDTNVGFTAAVRPSPALLISAVPGRMQRVSRGYMATSRPRFSVVLDDRRYHALTAFIARWRAGAQPSYHLYRRNCVHFVLDAAAAIGLNVNRTTPFLLDPVGFVGELIRLNPAVQRH